MNNLYIQTVRSELQENYQLLQRASWDAFQSELRLFLKFLEQSMITKSVLDELRAASVDVEGWKQLINTNRMFCLPDGYDYKQRAALCLALLEEVKSNSSQYAVMDILHLTISSSKISDHHGQFLTNILHPFYSYLDGKIDSGNFPLYLLNRFKCDVEWFRASQLLQDYSADTTHGEKTLDTNLRHFLFDQGIDYPFSTPLSSSGRADILANLDSDDYFVIEVKIFDGKDYDKRYIRKGFVQAKKYIEDHNKDFGFLVIFNVSNKEIDFDFKSKGWIRVNNKVIFIIVVNLNPSPLFASQRKKLDTYQISEEYLLSNGENIEA